MLKPGLKPQVHGAHKTRKPCEGRHGHIGICTTISGLIVGSSCTKGLMTSGPWCLWREAMKRIERGTVKTTASPLHFGSNWARRKQLKQWPKNRFHWSDKCRILQHAIQSDATDTNPIMTWSTLRESMDDKKFTAAHYATTLESEIHHCF